MVFVFNFPDVGEGLTEGTVVKWLVKQGDNVKKDQIIAEIETAKAVVEIPTPKTGKIITLHYKAGEIVKVGQPLVTIEEQESALQKKIPEIKTEEKKVEKATGKASMAEKAGGVVGFLEEEQKVIAPKQKIHIERREQGMLFGKGKEIAKQSIDAPKIGFESYGKVLQIPLSSVRTAIAQHLSQSWQTIPHVMHYDEADVTELWNVREKEKKVAEKKNIKLTFLPFIIRACIAAFKDNPYLNSSLDETNRIIVVKNYYNIGFAVDAPQGLLVPVIKKADDKSVLELAAEIQTLAEKARDKKLSPEDMSGGTFTITNIGSVGGLAATPIINSPEAAILGLYRILDKPVVRNGKIEIRKILPLTISFDHRILDGAQAAKFMNALKEHLEDPDRLLVDLS